MSCKSRVKSVKWTLAMANGEWTTLPSREPDFYKALTSEVSFLSLSHTHTFTYFLMILSFSLSFCSLARSRFFLFPVFTKPWPQSDENCCKWIIQTWGKANPGEKVFVCVCVKATAHCTLHFDLWEWSLLFNNKESERERERMSQTKERYKGQVMLAWKWKR